MQKLSTHTVDMKANEIVEKNNLAQTENLACERMNADTMKGRI